MPIETIEFKGKTYPAFQSIGGAALWVRPFADIYCKGIGLDIGYSKSEWKYPMALGIDESLNNGYHAMNLPDSKDHDLHKNPNGWPFIHSSHCLEHVKENWHNVLDYWLTKIKVGGIIFLYLPHKSQEYWLPENNRKHIHSFTGEEIEAYLLSLGHKVIRSGVDLNNSFVVVCEKVDKVVEYGSEQWYDLRDKGIADEKELYCQERNIEYIREGNNVIYNDPSCITYNGNQYQSDGGIVSGEFLDELKNSQTIADGKRIEADYFVNSGAIWYNGKRYVAS